MTTSRARVVSSYTIIKGSLVDETFAAFRSWDFALSRQQNLHGMRDAKAFGSASAHWSHDVAKVLNRRFDPESRDRPLVELAKAGCDRQVWKPILLWHMTRDEFLLRHFLLEWLYPHYQKGAYRLQVEDVLPFLGSLGKHKSIKWSGHWTDATLHRVASGLLRIAADFDLLKGGPVKEFASYHLPEKSFLYLLHVLTAAHPNARRVIESEDWRMYLLDAEAVEREILRLHQFRKLHYEVAGSLAQLRLPCASAAAYAKEMCA